MIIHKINPIIFNLGPISIRYYGLFYILGAILFYFIISYLVKKKHLELSKEDVFDFMVYELIGIFIGARFFYFLFYNLSSFTFLELISIWHGGMSFHGGLIGALIAGYIFCKIKKFNFWKLADLAVIPLALALAFGRLGNFINGEIYGKIWNGFACIDYSHNSHLNYLPKYCRIPVQFIELVKNLFIFCVLWIIKDKKFLKGTLFWLFVTLYGTLRFLVEFLRHQNEPLILIFSKAQILSFIMLIIGIIFLYKNLNRYKTNNSA